MVYYIILSKLHLDSFANEIGDQNGDRDKEIRIEDGLNQHVISELARCHYGVRCLGLRVRRIAEAIFISFNRF